MQDERFVSDTLQKNFQIKLLKIKNIYIYNSFLSMFFSKKCLNVVKIIGKLEIMKIFPLGISMKSELTVEIV